MTEPIITYDVKLQNETMYEDTSDFYAGTYVKTNPLVIDIRIWNNKYGTEQVEDLKNFALNFHFGTIEDSFILSFMKVTYNKTAEMNLDIVDNIALAAFHDDIVLSGKANNGQDSDKNNYIDISLKFEIDNSIQVKNMDLKSLYMEIVQQ